jgi:hypothetical protein
LDKYRSQEVASNKLENGPHRDYETAFCSPLAFMVLKKKVFQEFTVFTGFWPKYDLERRSRSNLEDEFYNMC